MSISEGCEEHTQTRVKERERKGREKVSFEDEKDIKKKIKEKKTEGKVLQGRDPWMDRTWQRIDVRSFFFFFYDLKKQATLGP